jgi:hypothetical protein
MYGSTQIKKRRKERKDRRIGKVYLSVYFFRWRHRYQSLINKRSHAYSIRFKSIETNWKWQASDSGDISCITSTRSYQWSEATRWCLYHEGHINPFIHLIQIKKEKEKEMRDALHLLFFHSHFPVYITQTYTWRIQSHTRKIQLCVMTSSAMNWAVALFSYKLILLNRHANTSQEERLELSLFQFIDYICIYQGQMSNFIYFFLLIEYLQFKNISWYSRWDCL